MVSLKRALAMALPSSGKTCEPRAFPYHGSCVFAKSLTIPWYSSRYRSLSHCCYGSTREQGARKRCLAKVARPGALTYGSSDNMSYVPTSNDVPKEALLRLARVHNVAPSMLLVFLGAWAGTGRTLLCLGHALSSLSVWVMSLVSGGVAVASVIINDYFDYSSGIDVQNSPDKPIPSGQIKPDYAVLISLGLYAMALISACLLEPRTVRVIVAWSAGVTLLYTPLLKRLTGVKNLVVAAIIAASPLSGALAAGAASEGLQAVLATCLWAFLGVLHREVLMDITDVEGDAQAGVLTMPVMWGQPAALAFSTACVVAASSFACSLALKGSGLAWMWELHSLPELLVRGLATCAVAFVATPLLQGCLSVLRSQYDTAVTSNAIDGSLLHIGLGMILTAVLA